MSTRRKYRLTRFLKAAVSGSYKAQFSQFGEDAIIYRQFPNDYVGTYLDIGAYHPFKWSNTARLWLLGWNGVNIDANRTSIKQFDRHRPLDRNIWAAIVPKDQYRKGAMIGFGGSTRAIDPLGRLVASSDKEPAAGLAMVPTLSLEEIAAYFDTPVDFMNIDTEGLDEAIIADEAFVWLSPRLLAIEQRGSDIEEILARESTRQLFSRGYAMVGRCIKTSLFRLKSAT